MTPPTLKERLQYRLDRFFQTGFSQQLSIALLLVAVFIAVFVLITAIIPFSPDTDFLGDNPDAHYWPSVRLWWVIVHTFENYWFEGNFATQVLSLGLTLFNLFVFAAVIGLVGSRIQARLEGMRRGTSRVIERNHVVLLGWSDKVIPIVHQLSIGLEQRRLTLVILSDREIDDVDSDLRRAFGRRRTLRWIARRGSTTDLSDLRLLSLEHARAVIVLHPDETSIASDTHVVKSIMAVGHLTDRDSRGGPATRPYIVAEIEQPGMHQIARAAARGADLRIVQSSDALGKILLQTVLRRGVVHVFNELLSHERNEIHITAQPVPALAGFGWSEVSGAYPRAVPIGVLRDGHALLVPHRTPDFVMAPGDRIIALAPDSSAVRSVTTPPNAHTDEDAPRGAVSRAAVSPDAEHGERSRSGDAPVHRGTPDTDRTEGRSIDIRSLLVIGCNERVFPIIDEFARHARDVGMRGRLVLVSMRIGADTALRGRLDAACAEAGDRVDIEMLERDCMAPGALNHLVPGDHDAVIVLGEEAPSAEGEDADTRAIMLLMLLRAMRDQGLLPGALRISGEIMNPENKELAEATGAIDDVIISNDVISRMISQLCREPDLEEVFADLFDEEGVEAYLRPATDYVSGPSATFSDLIHAAIERREVAIGIDRGAAHGGIVLNPERDRKVDLADARVVVLAE